MKKNIGSALALYPMPVTVIGAMNEEKPTWTLVAHVGIIGHDRVLVSLAAPHFINQFIKDTKKLSINIVDESFLPEADYAGSVSGAKEDKSTLFEYEMSEAGVPVIRTAPLTIDCTVEDIYETTGFESFICSINGTYVEEKYLNEDGKINYQTLKPVLFEFPTYEYLRTGDVLGKCLSFKKAPKESI
ncbi:MAG: flavin reductase family protein [Lachnospiraceae bacterium]|nr:flavin reductase family protein [Lachnospiraceae bacterium]